MRSSRLVSGLGIGAVLTMVLALGVVAGVLWEGHRVSSEPDHRPTRTDIGFAQDMSTHHDQAILMSRSLASDVAPEIRGLAERIAATQTAEVARMRGMLTWFGEPLTTDDPMSWMPPEPDGDHGAHTPGSAPTMAGMASTDELTRLARLTGTEAEIWFLQLMIRHHEGGLTMAVAAHNDTTASPVTKQLALGMIGEQGDEIGQMRLLLRARDAAPLPSP